MSTGATINPAEITLLTPIERAPYVTPERAAAFRRLGIPSIAHLIHHLPSRHESLEAEATIDQAGVGRIVSARGEITDCRPVGRGRRPRFEAVLMDHTGRLDLIWFNQPFLHARIHPGLRLRVQGKAARFGHSIRLTNPKWEIISDQGGEPGLRGARLRPVYPATEDLASWMIEQTIARVLDRALAQIEDHLPPGFRAERSLPPLRDAYRMMHRPASTEEVAAATRRLTYDELLLLQLGVCMKRAQVRRTLRAPPIRWSEAIDQHIRARLPFRLTPGQDEVIGEIAADLQRATPTNRLVQGDVGSGKTVVALYAMLMAVASRHQAALMAPTELLAEQHFASISRMLEGSAVRLALLTGGQGDQQRRSMLRRIASGDADLVIGTHALLTESVEFQSLGVAIIDEQHRFGVHQRARLREKAGDERSMPHTLVMTATPIPRTLALTIFGDLDVSTLKGLPPGRAPVTTRLVTRAKADEVYAYIRRRLDKGEQAYVVAPAIERDDDASLPRDPGDRDDHGPRDVRSVLRELEAGPMAGKRLAALHGRLKRETRERIMDRFRAGKIDLLVATSIIEVGVDVPNATMIIVEHADRFGLAQLHQLRGRVGRGARRSLCVLFTGGDEPATAEARARLKVLASTTDGFALAEKDLEIRGPGELIGARQAGTAPFRLAEFPRDLDLLLLARRDAGGWIDRSPALDAPEERLLRARLFKAHGEALGLVDVA